MADKNSSSGQNPKKTVIPASRAKAEEARRLRLAAKQIVVRNNPDSTKTTSDQVQKENILKAEEEKKALLEAQAKEQERLNQEKKDADAKAAQEKARLEEAQARERAAQEIQLLEQKRLADEKEAQLEAARLKEIEQEKTAQENRIKAQQEAEQAKKREIELANEKAQAEAEKRAEEAAIIQAKKEEERKQEEAKLAQIKVHKDTEEQEMDTYSFASSKTNESSTFNQPQTENSLVNKDIRNELKMKEPENEKKRPIGLIISLVVLLGLLIGAFFMITNEKTTVKQLTVEKTQLLTAKDSLQREISDYIENLKQVKTDNKKMQAQIDKQVEELEALQEELKKEKSGGDKAQLEKYRSSFNGLKQQNKELQAKVEALQKEKELMAKANDSIAVKIDSVQKDKQVLEGEKQELESQVDLGSKLITYLVVSDPIYTKSDGKEKVTNKAKKTEKIRVCYTVGKNLIAKSETKTAYIRVIDPKGGVLSDGMNEANQFEFNGAQLVYSAKTDFLYENKDQDVCVYFTKKEEINPGKYKVEIYTDGSLIGSSKFELE